MSLFPLKFPSEVPLLGPLVRSPSWAKFELDLLQIIVRRPLLSLTIAGNALPIKPLEHVMGVPCEVVVGCAVVIVADPYDVV